jgi:SAM-dependent methyltransferase
MTTAHLGPHYEAAFYRELDLSADVSARQIIPRLRAMMTIGSVVDIGCGAGGWLAEFRRAGITDVLGVDGPWVEDSLLKIPLANFQRARLDAPFVIPRRFSLAMSLEVAEHLPEDKAPEFIAQLAELAPVVLFSAAVPGQGGVHHFNEQWPSYWTRLFSRHGFRAIDALRQSLWNEREVAYWYKQNLMFFASPAGLETHPNLAAAAKLTPAEPLALVHPELFDLVLRRARPGFGRWLKMAPAAVRRSLRRKRA